METQNNKTSDQKPSPKNHRYLKVFLIAFFTLILFSGAGKAQESLKNDILYASTCLHLMGGFKEDSPALAECKLLRDKKVLTMWQALWNSSLDAIDPAQRTAAEKLWFAQAASLGVGELPRTLKPLGQGRIGLSNAGRLLNDAVVLKIRDCVKQSACPALKPADWVLISNTLDLLLITKSNQRDLWEEMKTLIPTSTL